MIKREHYISKIREFYESDLIKIITGIRRCGKSIVLEQIKEEIEAKGNKVLYLNFEDKYTLNKYPDCDALLEYINEQIKKQKLYIFLDEIQLVENWAEACKTIRLWNTSLFITGSNSKLLSGEFTKHFSGRYVSFRIRPFVYKEIKEYADELKKTVSISDYLTWGGFPKRFEYDSNEALLSYLNSLDDTIIINDLIRRYRIRKVESFKAIVNFILKSNSRIISATSIKKTISQDINNVDVKTIIKYISYLEEAYAIDEISQYSTKTKSELQYHKKLYNADVALNSIRSDEGRYDLTHNLENIVYNELLFRGYKLYVYNNNGKEINFLAIKDQKKYLIQVAYSVVDEKAYEREFGAFKNIDNENQKIIITNDDIDFSTSTVKHIKLKDFLECEEL